MTQTPMTRRRFVATGAAAAVGLTTPSLARASTRRSRRVVDVIVVGGGLAGLTAARRVAAGGHSVVVLEARDRVGGRVWNHDLGHGVVTERGGTFIGPTQNHLAALAREVKVDTYASYDTGDDVYLGTEGRFQYSDRGVFGTAPPDPAIEGDLAKLVLGIDAASTKVPVKAPWEAANAAALDRQTLADYLTAQGVSPEVMELTAAATRPIFGAEPRDLSMLFVLFYIAASGDKANPGTFQRNFNTRGGAQQDRFVGGSQRVPLALAAALGDRVVLSAPVRAVEHSATRATVHTDRATWHARRVIVAVPPVLAQRIRISGLTAARRALQAHYSPGSLTKVAAVYDRPFWREKGLTGSGLTLGGPVSFSYDDTPPGGRPGIMVGFVGGDNARAYARTGAAARRHAVLSQFADFFVDAQALRPTAFIETSWAQQAWTRGCPVGIPAIGSFVRDGRALRDPVGPIHWAGSETATYWNGYMDGAVSSGERAAAEVRAAL